MTYLVVMQITSDTDVIRQPKDAVFFVINQALGKIYGPFYSLEDAEKVAGFLNRFEDAKNTQVLEDIEKEILSSELFEKYQLEFKKLLEFVKEAIEAKRSQMPSPS